MHLTGWNCIIRFVQAKEGGGGCGGSGSCRLLPVLRLSVSFFSVCVGLESVVHRLRFLAVSKSAAALGVADELCTIAETMQGLTDDDGDQEDLWSSDDEDVPSNVATGSFAVPVGGRGVHRRK